MFDDNGLVDMSLIDNLAKYPDIRALGGDAGCLPKDPAGSEKVVVEEYLVLDGQKDVAVEATKVTEIPRNGRNGE